MLTLVQTDHPGHARAISFGRLKQVWLGRGFAALPEDQQAAVLAHEAGHCHHHHLEARWLCLIFTPLLYPWLCRRQELEADRYAASLGHGQALSRFLASECAGGWFHPSHAERREVLERHEQTRLAPVTGIRLVGVTDKRS